MTLLDQVNKSRITRELYQRVFNSEDGRRVLQHILLQSYVTKPTFVKGDINETILREGMRRLALSILTQVCKDEQEMTQMTETVIKNENPI